MPKENNKSSLTLFDCIKATRPWSFTASLIPVFVTCAVCLKLELVPEISF